MSKTLALNPIDAGFQSLASLNEKHLNPFAVELLVESVTASRLLDALPEGVSFCLDTPDSRHKGVRISITKES